LIFLQGGAAYGAVWSLIPSIVGDLFPPQRFATFYNLFALAASGSSLLLSTILATRVYAAHAHAPGEVQGGFTPPGAEAPVDTGGGMVGVGGPGGGAAECHGGACYRATHLTVLAVCACGAACALVLAARNRQVYRRLGAQ